MSILRFKGENGQEYPPLRECLVGEFTEELSERNKTCRPLDVYSVNNKVGFVPQSEQFEEAGYLNGADTSIYMLAPPNTFAYNPARLDVGSIGYQNVGHDVQISSLYEVFRTNNQVDDLWLWYWFHSEYFKCEVFRFQEGGVRQYFYYDKLERTPIKLPSLEEQQKVATFLSLYDQKIENQMAKVEALETRRKGLLQQIFSQEIRFKADDGSEFPDWEETELNTYLYENKERNKDNKFGKEDVLSVSKDFGVINQIQYQGRSLAGGDVSNYHIVHSGNVVYTKSPLGRQPYGIIKASHEEGIVSTLYAVYYCRDNALPEIIDYYFSLDDTLNRYLKPLVNIGAKHDMKVNNTDALAGIVTLPSSLEEQRKIVDFLQLVDKQIQVEKDKLEAIKQVKKGLLQQMFV